MRSVHLALRSLFFVFSQCSCKRHNAFFIKKAKNKFSKNRNLRVKSKSCTYKSIPAMHRVRYQSSTQNMSVWKIANLGNIDPYLFNHEKEMPTFSDFHPPQITSMRLASLPENSLERGDGWARDNTLQPFSENMIHMIELFVKSTVPLK
ncbi:hypothetical protein XU18_1843 [Perkinsela sp. CCAP 1560/4]|nr:hypothetical protein XU18_1843 [Perkinsela sp. CCAP 1560/4]|eukprot:KNH07311.1 hypothetical protein XU18_1843 [Perkinsela sp. CCAP 1560/4]